MHLSGLLTLVILFSSDLKDPSSPAAVAAKKVYTQQVTWAKSQRDQEIQRIQTQYEGEVSKARLEYEKRLKDALKAALAAQNLDEGNRIDAELKEVKAPEVGLPPQGRFRSRIVRGRTDDEYLVDWVIKDKQITEVRYVDRTGKIFDWGAAGKTKGTLKIQTDGSFRLDQDDWGYSVFTFTKNRVFLERFEKGGTFHIGSGDIPK